MTPVTKDDYLRSKLRFAKSYCFLALFVFVLLLGWQGYTTFGIHKDYQRSLMQNSGQRVVSEYDNHLTSLREQIDAFQHQYRESINVLVENASKSNSEDYMALLKSFRAEIDGVRLFSVIDENGVGLFKSITGDFLPDCKNEIDTTISANSQEQLFLHRSASSVHYDILQPLITNGESLFLFVAFNASKLQKILEQNCLPHQEIYLLRNDLRGKVDISVNSEGQTNLAMEDLQEPDFSYSEPIPRTRWNVAVRLSDSYDKQLISEIVLKAALIWFVLAMVLLGGYWSKRKRVLEEFSIKSRLEFSEARDGLTGLLNLKTWLSVFSAERPLLAKNVGAAFVVDIDKFQTLNNVAGFAKGDECLRTITENISGLMEKEVQFARIGSDQFTIFHPTLAHDEVELFAEFLKRLVEECEFESVPDVSLTAGVGALKISDEIQDEEHLMDALLIALKLAKAKGPNNIQLYQSTDPLLTAHAQEMSIYSALKQAFVEDNFELHLQKIVSSDDQKSTFYYEVLVRMNVTNDKQIPPGVFIPVAEAHGMATRLDKWVIRNSLLLMRKKQDIIHVAINLSGATLADPEMVEFVKSQLSASGVSPKRVAFEVTETFAITHIESARYFISELTELGCQFALDDFGSGLSSFSYLQTLPVKKLKIDGVFIKDIANNVRNQQFVKAMVNLATSLEMETVAEFVETEQDVEVLTSLQVDYLQGYYFSKPSKWQ